MQQKGVVNWCTFLEQDLVEIQALPLRFRVFLGALFARGPRRPGPSATSVGRSEKRSQKPRFFQILHGLDACRRFFRFLGGNASAALLGCPERRERREERGMSRRWHVARLGARDGELASRTERPRDKLVDEQCIRPCFWPKMA